MFWGSWWVGTWVCLTVFRPVVQTNVVGLFVLVLLKVGSSLFVHGCVATWTAVISGGLLQLCFVVVNGECVSVGFAFVESLLATSCIAFINPLARTATIARSAPFCCLAPFVAARTLRFMAAVRSAHACMSENSSRSAPCTAHTRGATTLSPLARHVRVFLAAAQEVWHHADAHVRAGFCTPAIFSWALFRVRTVCVRARRSQRCARFVTCTTYVLSVC